MNFTSGKNSRFGVNAIVYNGKGWSVDPQGSETRVDNTSDNGYSDRIVSIKDCKFTLDFEWDTSVNLMSAAPTLVIGTVLTNVYLYLDYAGSTTVAWYLPKAIVLTTPMTAKVGDAIKWTVTGANKGTFSPPSGSFTPSAFGA